MVGKYGRTWEWKGAYCSVHLLCCFSICAAQAPVSDLDRWSDSAFEQYYYHDALDYARVDSVLMLYPAGTITPGKEKLYRIMALYSRKKTEADRNRPYMIGTGKSTGKYQSDSSKLALILAGMGEGYRISGQLSRADSVLRISMNIADRHRDSLGVAYAHGCYAALLLERGILDTTAVLPHYRTAVTWYPQPQHHRDVSAAMISYAHKLSGAGRAGEAVNILQQAAKLTLDSASVCRLYNQMAEVYKDAAQYDSAVYYARRAYDISTRRGLNSPALDAALIIQGAYDSLDNFKLAYDWSLIHHALLSISLQDTRENMRIAELERDRDRQRIENELLRSEQAKHEEDVQRFRWFVIFISMLAAILIMVAIYLLRQRRGLREAQEALRGSKLKIEEQNAELKKYLKVRDRLISVASHDLRAPLATVKNLLDLFSNDRLTPEELRGLVTMLEAQYQRSLDMADNLLLWAKSQLEGIEAKATAFDLMEMTEEVLSFSKPVIESSGVKVQLSTKGEARAYADVEMSKFVIRNLLHNAIKFSDAGDLISIDIVRDNGVVRWCIEDEGPGMSKAQIDELFRVGSRIDSKDPKKGAGIGLYLSHYFAELNEGQLLAWSEIGKGSTFCFELKSASGTAPIPKN